MVFFHVATFCGFVFVFDAGGDVLLAFFDGVFYVVVFFFVFGFFYTFACVFVVDEFFFLI